MFTTSLTYSFKRAHYTFNAFSWNRKEILFSYRTPNAKIHMSIFLWSVQIRNIVKIRKIFQNVLRLLPLLRARLANLHPVLMVISTEGRAQMVTLIVHHHKPQSNIFYEEFKGFVQMALYTITRRHVLGFGCQQIRYPYLIILLVDPGTEGKSILQTLPSYEININIWIDHAWLMMWNSYCEYGVVNKLI